MLRLEENPEDALKEDKEEMTQRVEELIKKRAELNIKDKKHPKVKEAEKEIADARAELNRKFPPKFPFDKR